MSDTNEDNLRPRKRLKLSVSSKHIYETMFKQHQISDVTIVILDRSWKLHKTILKQSAYFASMFSGSWKESGEQVVQVEVNDPNITHDSVDAVLGALYSDEIELGADNVMSILATAALLQIQHIIDKCSEAMREHVNFNNVFAYYEAAESYGVPSVKTSAFEWLETNLHWLARKTKDISFLKNISIELMSSLTSSPDFVVNGTEKTIYSLLKKWLAVHIGKLEDESTYDFYKRQTWSVSFLMTEEGAKYKLPFESLRMEHLMAYDTLKRKVRNDNILPSEWISSSFEKLWQHEVLITSEIDLGPTEIDEKQFNENSLRFGGLFSESPQLEGFDIGAFQFSMDFSIHYDSSEECFTIGRIRSLELGRANVYQKLETEHNILIRVSLISIDEDRRVTHTTRSPILHFCLGPSKRVKVMDFDEDNIPSYLLVQWLIVTP